jgi:thiamine-monophosphate kinase
MEPRTEITSLGEFGLIDHLTKNIEIRNASTILGVGDDAAVIDHFGKQTVLSTDMLVRNIHFDLMYTPSCIWVMCCRSQPKRYLRYNAIPTQILISVAFSNRFSLEALDEFYEGFTLPVRNTG